MSKREQPGLIRRSSVEAPINGLQAALIDESVRTTAAHMLNALHEGGCVFSAIEVPEHHKRSAEECISRTIAAIMIEILAK